MARHSSRIRAQARSTPGAEYPLVTMSSMLSCSWISSSRTARSRLSGMAPTSSRAAPNCSSAWWWATCDWAQRAARRA